LLYRFSAFTFLLLIINSMKKFIVLVFAAGVLVGFAINQNSDTIMASDVFSAQKLIGLQFNKQEVDTLLEYLDDNRKGYESLRKYKLGNDVSPAVSFDPYPTDLVIVPNNAKNEWVIPKNITRPKNDTEVAFMSITELASLIKYKKITATELTNIYLKRIEKYDDTLESFITVTKELALKQAAQADAEIAAGKYRGVLHGIPYGIKDLAAVPGYPTTWGAAPYQDQTIDQTATVAAKLEAAGAVLLGKLVSGSLARGDVWFDGKTKNPWNLEEGASGSSAGPGSATAAGLVAFSIGTETLGSITSPSTRCGLTGLRPTYGAVSRAGFMTLSWSMDKVGPMCRLASDCAIVFDAIIGQDNIDRSVKNFQFLSNGNFDVKKMRIAYFKTAFEGDSSSNSSNNNRTLEELRKLGANLEAIELPKDFPFEAFDIILRAEAGAFFDELLLSGRDSLMVEQHQSSRANSLRQSRFIPAVEYIQANRHRRLLIDDMHARLKNYDAIISPTSGSRQVLITNLTGHPAISVPNGFKENGSPTSFTIIGNYFQEANLLALGQAYQKAYNYAGKVPKGFE
jgi:Asp-tRNA(Asn)/Glu-tRNA(Gln) amidotransferase A subunit family amidase